LDFKTVLWTSHDHCFLGSRTNFKIVSDPYHERYGQHLSAEEVNELVKPTDETFEQVHEWLDDCGVHSSKLEYSGAKDWIKVTLPVKDIERLLDTKYSVFKHADGSHLVRTPKWSLPVHLHEHIETIQPTNSFFQPKPKRTTLKTVQMAGLEQYLSSEAVSPVNKATVAEACNVTAVTPTCLRTLYGQYNFRITTRFASTNILQGLSTMFPNLRIRIKLQSAIISEKQTTDRM
jgi:tripeptidyl-peptidase I